MGDILKFLSRSDIIWLLKEKVGLGGYWWFLTGDLEDGVIFEIMNHVVKLYWRYSERLIRIGHDLAEKGKGRDLKDVDSPWLETWRIGSSLTSKIILLDDKKDILKVWRRSKMINLFHRGYWVPCTPGGPKSPPPPKKHVGAWFVHFLNFIPKHT